MYKKWIYRDGGDSQTIETLMAQLGINRVLASLLVQRGIGTFEEARAFFRPTLDMLHDPFLMKGMDKAVERIERAITSGEKILVYGDYDVDGTTAVALVYSFFQKRYPNISYYIPDRYDEGYGISYKGVDYAFDKGYSLIIALDCGIKAIEKIKYAKLRNIDFIICDHHLPGDEVPAAVAVLDPKQSDCNYPFKELSGCGVGFKLIHGFCKQQAIALEETYEYLDLVAVSIASDIVPVVDENRVLAHYGLRKLNEKPSRGLKAIIKFAGIDKSTIGIDDIVFRIGPRINAAGRMEQGKSAVDLLCAENDSVAYEMASIVNSCNDDRRHIDRNITHEALRRIASDSRMRNCNTTVLFDPSWHKGVVGIVASRLIETYYRPTVVLTESNGLATGSARSVPGFDLHEAIEKCSDLLENFGGHMYAAGLSMKPSNVPAFIERFEKVVSNLIEPEMLIPSVTIDANLDFENIDKKFFSVLQQFCPYGPENMAPIFASHNVSDNGSILVGKEKEHIKLSLKQDGLEQPMGGIAFQMAEHYSAIRKGKPFSICYSVEENTFKGVTSMQLRVKDIQHPESEGNTDEYSAGKRDTKLIDRN